ncbi:MAG: iron ABC transporter permease [Acidaminococcales bacterium]|jgi:iron complex transport system permease protein|nr:iron ABC transporter permease [Acidaminococcales bacterium]
MKMRWSFVFAFAALLISVCLLLASGAHDMGFAHFTRSLLGLGDSFTAQEELIVWRLRWPRILLSLTVGAALATAGVCQQAIFKNPLAEPFILGISGGAALGAAIAIIAGYPNLIAFMAFVGGISTVAIVKGLDAKFASTGSVTHLLLAGVAISSLAGACLSALMSLYSQQMQLIFFWIMGSVAMPPDNYPLICGFIILCIAITCGYARELDLISIGDEQAFFLGVEVKKVRNIVLFLSAVITSLAVSMSGTIGFIGLVAPHLLRNWTGASHVTLLPLSAVWGGIMLLWADGLIRLTPWFSALPVGVITALFGAPFFLYILWARGRM